MRTPKFNQDDLQFIKRVLETEGFSVKETAKRLGISLMTMYKIKNETYQPNTREGAKSGLPAPNHDASRQVSLF